MNRYWFSKDSIWQLHINLINRDAPPSPKPKGSIYKLPNEVLYNIGNSFEGNNTFEFAAAASSSKLEAQSLDMMKRKYENISKSVHFWKFCNFDISFGIVRKRN